MNTKNSFNMDEQFVESRRTKLEWYLRQLLFLPSLRKSEDLATFFEVFFLNFLILNLF